MSVVSSAFNDTNFVKTTIVSATKCLYSAVLGCHLTHKIGHVGRRFTRSRWGVILFWVRFHAFCRRDKVTFQSMTNEEPFLCCFMTRTKKDTEESQKIRKSEDLCINFWLFNRWRVKHLSSIFQAFLVLLGDKNKEEERRKKICGNFQSISNIFVQGAKVLRWSIQAVPGCWVYKFILVNKIFRWKFPLAEVSTKKCWIYVFTEQCPVSKIFHWQFPLSMTEISPESEEHPGGFDPRFQDASQWFLKIQAVSHMTEVSSWRIWECSSSWIFKAVGYLCGIENSFLSDSTHEQGNRCDPGINVELPRRCVGHG